MPVRLNFCANARFSPPGGMPLDLNPQSYMSASGVLPLGYESISATLKADKEATVRLALYSAPLLVGDSDNALINSTITRVMSTEQTLTLDVPTDLAPEPIEPDGTITITGGSTSVIGSATAFKAEWEGYEIQVKSGAWYQISSVTSTTALTLAGPAASISAGAGAFLVRRPRPVAFVFVVSAESVVGDGGIEISEIVAS